MFSPVTLLYDKVSLVYWSLSSTAQRSTTCRATRATTSPFLVSINTSVHHNSADHCNICSDIFLAKQAVPQKILQLLVRFSCFDSSDVNLSRYLTAISVVIQHSLAEGPGMIGDLTELIQVSKRLWAQSSSFKKGQGALSQAVLFAITWLRALPELLQDWHGACSGIMADVLCRIDHKVRAPQLVRHWSHRSCKNEVFTMFQSWHQYPCCLAG